MVNNPLIKMSYLLLTLFYITYFLYNRLKKEKE